MRILNILVLVLVTGALAAQSGAPGGVPAPWCWSVTRTNHAGELTWQQLGQSAGTYSLSDQPTLLLNDWPVPLWQPARLPANFTVPASLWAGVTLFTVYQTTNPQQEQVLWSWEPADREPLVCTNQRLADLEKRQYFNWSAPSAALRLATYHQAEQVQTSTPGTLRLGQRPPAYQLPITDWRGSIAEWLIYPRVLSPRQRLQVESYLALKYGITLGAGQDYLDSRGEVWWSATKNQAYHHRVFGLGHDEGSGWIQYRSQSAELPDFLALRTSGAPSHNGLAGPPFPDQTAWILGDNDAPLTWTAQETATDEQWLDRQWLLAAHGATAFTATELKIDLGRWLTAADESTSYLLAIDRSGTGDFSAATTDLIPLDHLSLGRFGYFTHIHWDTDGSGTDVFTVVRKGAVAQKVKRKDAFLRIYPNPLNHQQAWQWQLHLPTAVPLSVTLTNAQGQVLEEMTLAADTYFARQQPPLPSGVYGITCRYGSQLLTQKLIVQ